ncbi:tyrosine-type recombinase/integrase [Lysinibacillus fusiformis]|uniref:tyrosine-type recombinase/integrase n=1 Tax=Lysinibacillus fusiformis TaxID=28031 RepID=UPI003D002E79
MASYEILNPTKKGEPRIKITVEEGYDDRGRRIRFTKTVRMKSLSDRAIKKSIKEFELEVATSNKVTKNEEISFEAFVLGKWMKLHVKKNLRLRTYQTYNSTLTNYIIPFFKGMKLSKIKPIHIEEFFAYEKDSGRKNLKGKYLILKSIFTKAITWKFISKENDPMEGIKEPNVDKRHREKSYYNEEELLILFKVLEGVQPKQRIAIKMAAVLGLRRSEILGIRHHSVNFNNNTILIDAQLHYDHEQKKFLLGPPKNGLARTVIVPDKFMEEIKAFMKEHRKQKELCGDAWDPAIDENGEPLDLLYTNPYGYPNHLNSITNEWVKLLKRHKLDYINFHGLRHSFASFMIANNSNIKVIQEQLGHVDVRQTIQTYSHLTKDEKLKEISKFDEIL